MTPRVDAWMRQANSDWAVAELTARQGFHNQACYHYGQAAEKELKALLISLGSLPPYSHALERLVDSLESAGLDVQPLRELRLKALSRMTARRAIRAKAKPPLIALTTRTAIKHAALRSTCWPSRKPASNRKHDIYTISKRYCYDIALNH